MKRETDEEMGGEDNFSDTASAIETTDASYDLDNVPQNPTNEIYSFFDFVGNFFNDELFDGCLPPFIFTLRNTGQTFGHFVFKNFRNTTNDEADEICLNPSLFHVRSVEDTLADMVHEMTHLAQYHFGNPARGRYHNKEFAKMLKASGLYPSSTGQIGGAETGEKMSHYIIEGGAFALAVQKLKDRDLQIPWAEISDPIVCGGTMGLDGSEPPSKSKKPKLIEYFCPEFEKCGQSAKAVKDANLKCGECDLTLLDKADYEHSMNAAN